MQATPEQLHEMLTYCMGFARTMLEEAGDFYPFGATLSPKGVVAAVGADSGEERPAPAEIYKLLGEALLNGAASGEHAGVALAANVNIPPEYSSQSQDGLRVHLETRGTLVSSTCLMQCQCKVSSRSVEWYSSPSHSP